MLSCCSYGGDKNGQNIGQLSALPSSNKVYIMLIRFEAMATERRLRLKIEVKFWTVKLY